MATLDIQGLSIALPRGADRDLAVSGLSLSIEPGRTLCVVGESGSGKSVMALAIMGLIPRELRAAGGSISLNSESLLDAAPARLRALRGKVMGMVFQEPMTALNPVMPCGEQIDELLREHTNWPGDRRAAEIRQILDRVHIHDIDRIMGSHPHQLSGGQRQRIVIAMAAILKPALLICDEPTTALDVTTQKEILRLIAELQRDQGSAVLFITHDMGVVADIADDVLVMHQGRGVESGPRHQVLHTPRADYTRMLLQAVPSMTPPPPRPSAQGPSRLAASALGKTYINRDLLGRERSTVALRNASLSLLGGETVGVVGESGSGKSSLARCLIRLIDPTSGSILWGSDEVATKTEAALRPLRHRVQVVFQDPNRSLNPRRTVGQSIIEGAINFGTPRKEALALAVQLLEKVRLPASSLDRYPSQFSGGQRQRIAIARALACKPEVLVADEAVSALDVSVQAQILDLLRSIQRELGLGLLFITHDLRVAAQLCDRVIVMQHGEIVEQGPTHSLYAHPQHPYTRHLFASAPRGLDTMRILVAGFQHETNTFAPSLADWAAFNRGDGMPPYQRGPAMLDTLRDVNIPIAGFARSARERGWELIASNWAGASPSAHVTREAFERISADLLEDVRAALANGLDAVYLDLHGAAVAEHVDDAEGELLARVRALIGDDRPLVASLDLHANVTARMLACADALVSYRTYPHIDMADTGARAAELLSRHLTRGRRAAVAVKRFPFLISLNAQSTWLEPAKGIYELLEALEHTHDVTMSFCMGFPAADFDECGPVLWAHGDTENEVNEAVDSLFARAAAPEQWRTSVLDAADCVARAITLAEGAQAPVVIADTEDNPGAGGDSNTTGLLHALIAQQAGRRFPRQVAFGLLFDPDTARAAHEAGVGAVIERAIGASVLTYAGMSPAPVSGRFRVLQLSDGRTRLAGPMMTGAPINLGLSACLDIDGILIAVVSGKAQLLDRVLLTMVGIDAQAMRIIGVKSSNHFRADFTPIASHVLVCKSIAPMAADPADLDWKHLPAATRTRP